MGRYFLLLLLLAYSFLFILSLPDFGPSWDSELGEFQFGDKTLAFLKSGDPSSFDTSPRTSEEDKEFLSSGWGEAHPEHIWSFGPTFSALSRELFAKRLGWFGSITARHVFLLPLVLLLFLKFFRFGRKYLSDDIATLAVLALACYPRFWADAHNNIKDIPSAVFISLTLMYFFEAVVSESRLRYVLAGIFWGAALASKANALFLPLTIGLWLLCTRKRPRWTWVFNASCLALLTFAVLSPFYVFHPAYLEKQFQYLFEIGASGGPMWKLMPSVNALATMPGTFLPFFILGILVLPRTITKEPSFAFLLLFWAFLPILRFSLPYANDFDVIRHWLEVVPAFTFIFGIGLSEALKCLGRFKVPALLLVFAPIIAWNVGNHPYNLCFYNSYVGGLSGAQEHQFAQSTDYWGSSYRMGIRWLNEHAEKDSQLYVGVGEHIVAGVANDWLRPDINLKPYTRISDETRRTRYLMYITRKDRYPENLLSMSPSDRLVWEARVDGAPILKIFQLQ